MHYMLWYRWNRLDRLSLMVNRFNEPILMRWFSQIFAEIGIHRCFGELDMISSFFECFFKVKQEDSGSGPTNSNQHEVPLADGCSLPTAPKQEGSSEPSQQPPPAPGAPSSNNEFNNGYNNSSHLGGPGMYPNSSQPAKTDPYSFTEENNFNAPPPQQGGGPPPQGPSMGPPGPPHHHQGYPPYGLGGYPPHPHMPPHPQQQGGPMGAGGGPHPPYHPYHPHNDQLNNPHQQQHPQQIKPEQSPGGR